jgi:hypothetical protein
LKYLQITKKCLPLRRLKRKREYKIDKGLLLLNIKPITLFLIFMQGIKIIQSLEELDFFNLTAPNHLGIAKQAMIDSYNEHQFFMGEINEETDRFMDNRFYFMDCETLFEVGGITEYLEIVKPFFEKLGLVLEYNNEQDPENENGNHWNHTIDINSKTYTVYEGATESVDIWAKALTNFTEMINDQLISQKNENRLYLNLCCSGNDGIIVF